MRSFEEIRKILGDLPDSISDIKKIYLLGSTGAGKTSLVRNIIDTVKYAFPTTSQTRTTIAPTEYIITKKLPFKTTIIFKQKEEIINSIEELVFDAIETARDNYKLNKTSIEDVVLKLEESSDERFRLKYMVPKDVLEDKAKHIISEIIPRIIDYDNNDETIFSDLDVKIEIDNIVKVFLEEIEIIFNKITNGNYELFSDELFYIDDIFDKETFINRNKELLKYDFGSLTLLVEYIRIEGNLLADWFENDYEFILIDGEGIGHSLKEKRDTLSVRHYDYFDYCNQILLVEKGDDPFISGGQGAIESIFLNGYRDKFKLIFSKIDKIENNDRNGFLRRRLVNLKDALEEEKIVFDIENKDTYKLENLNAEKNSDYSKKEIKRLLTDIDNIKDTDFTPLEYDFNLFFSELDTQQFIKDFRRIIDNEHWMVVKAFSRRMYNKETEYKHIKPISWILTFIMRDINEFLKRDDQLRSEIYTSQNKIKQEFSKKLRFYIYKNLILEQNYLWKEAYEEYGKGSHKRRKDFIFKHIIKSFLPNSNDDQEFKKFKKEIKTLLIDSGAKELESAKKIIIKNINIQKIYGYKNFQWKLADDVNILIGKNGSGKSTILKLIHASICKNKELLDKFSYPYIELTLLKQYEDGVEQEVKVTNNKRAMDVKSIMIDTFDIETSKCENTDTELDCSLKKIVNDFGNYQRKISKVLDRETEEINDEISEIMEKISEANPHDLEKFQKLSIEKKSIKDRIFRDINLFKKMVDSFLSDTNKEIIIEDDKEPLLIKLKDKIIVDNEGDNIVDITKISSGEKQLLIIFLTILLIEKKPVILLMDEPETSLHVEWQSRLIDSIKQLNPNIPIIIATHNPLLMLNRNSDEIGVIEIGEEVVSTEGKGTKYADISAILIRYFGLHSLVGKDMQDKVEKLFELKDKRENDNFSEEDKKQLKLIEDELDGTMASRFIYDRAYFKFLMFVKENNHIDFSGLKKLNKQDFNSLLDKYKAQF